MLHRYIQICAALLCILGGTACQCGEGDEPEVAQAMALSGTQSTCSESQINHSTTCSGPWEYSDYKACYIKKPSPACPIIGYGTMQCTVPLSCEHPDFGVEYSYNKSYTLTTNAQGFLQSYQHCWYDYTNHPSGDLVCETYEYYDGDAACAAVAEMELAEVDDRYEGSVWIENLSASPHRPTSAWEAVTCRFTLANYPKYRSMPNAALCGTRQETCTNPNDPQYAACRHSSHGLTTDPAECYNENPSADLIEPTRQYSPPGLDVSNLRAAASSRAVVTAIAGYAPRCTTADTLPMSNSAQLRTKFDALMSQLASLDSWEASPTTAPANVNRPVLRRQVVTNAKVLFELKGAFLNDTAKPTRANEAIALYDTYPEGGFRKVTRVDPKVDFTWNGLAPMTGMPADLFSVRWKGKVTPRFSETYTFYTASDDGVRLWVNNQPLINNWTLHGNTENSGSITLEAGKEYDLRLEFFENTGDAVARLLWSSRSQPKEVIPSSQLKAVDGTPGLTGEYFDNTYFDNRDFTAQTDCGNPWATAPVGDDACTGARDVNARFAMCSKMVLDHVPPSSAGLIVSRCIDALGKAQATSCTKGRYVAEYDQILPPLLKEYLALPHTKTDPGLTQVLQRKLSYIDRWYRSARTYAHGGDRMSIALNQRTSELLGEFWRGAYMSEHPLGMREDGLELPAETVTVDRLPTLSDDYLKVDRAVLMAAFSNQASSATPPMTSAPLILVTSDALRGMAQRLDNVADAHDLGCRFRGCAAGKISTQVSQLWRLLSTLSDSSQLNAAVLSSGKVEAAWLDTFKQMNTRHDILQGALKDSLGVTAYSPLALEAKTVESHPVLIKEFVALVRDARQRTTNYDQTGAFDATLRNVLHTGMNSEKQAEINTYVDTTLANLMAAINDFAANRQGLVTTYLEEMRAKREQDRTMNLIRSRLKRLGQLDTDLAGMRHNARTADARQAEFVRTFEALTSQPQVAEYQVQKRAPQTLSLSARNDAKYSKPEPQTPAMSDSIRALAAQGWVRQADAGDILRIDVSGSWAPTCAFNSPLARLRIPGHSEGVPVDTTGVTTGPEGFLVQMTGSGYKASAVTSTSSNGTYQSISTSGEACLGVKASAGVELAGSGVVAYAEANACVSASQSAQWSTTESDSSTNGQERRSSASFTTGLRLPNTPFPRLPAGSLLLVEVKRGGSLRQDIVQIHPLQRSWNTLLINNPQSDLYLVVNDRACESSSTQALSVTVYHTQRVGSGDLAQKLLQAMASAKTAIEKEGETALKEGRIRPETLASLRSSALARLQQNCSCELASYPSHLQSLFTAWVDHELASLARHAEIIAAEREMSLLMIELEGMGADLARQQSESRLLKLLPLWALRNMEGAELEAKTKDVTDAVNHYLFPIISLRYPEVITTLNRNTDAVKEMMALTEGTEISLPTGPNNGMESLNPGWTRSRLATAKVVRAFVNRVKTVLANARLGSDNSTAQFPVLALSFPRPDLPETGWQSVYTTADKVRSAKVWEELLNGKKASFTVFPEDLYHLNGGERMLCNQGTMVIRSMSLFFSLPGIGPAADTMNGLPQVTPVWVDKSLVFAAQGGPQVYEQLNPKWIDTYISPIFGEPHEAKTKFAQWRQSARRGNGLSPFTTFDINPTALRTWTYQPLQTAYEAVLLFEVEVEPLPQGSMQWIKTCAPQSIAARP